MVPGTYELLFDIWFMFNDEHLDPLKKIFGL